MKATELMIRDIVLIEGTPRIVSQITKHKIGYHRTELPFGECKMSYTKLYEVSPIPLTSEILEKNGWKWDNTRGEYVSSTFSLEWDIDLHEAWLRIGGEFTIIAYVHELQHALRLCGLHDLADNFKI